MLKDNAIQRKEHFSANWLAWSALHHFLPAPMLRELSYVIVDRMSNGSLRFDQLFEETLPEGSASFSSWMIRPLQPSSSLAEYLQYRIRVFVWQSDSVGFSWTEATDLPGAISPSVLEKAVEFGATDFSSSCVTLSTEGEFSQPSMDHFIQSFISVSASCKAANTDEFIASLEPLLRHVEMPLTAVIMKHFGDLCVDMDEWDKALELYKQVERILASDVDHVWDEFIPLIRVINTQSISSAIRTLQGSKESAELLNTSLASETIVNAPLFHGNASFDAFVVASQANISNLPHDLRATVLLPPLLHEAHSDSAAMKNWLNGKFDDANKRFWAVLRRQIALGSAFESRTTKSLYARSLFDEIDQVGARRSVQQSFNMATRLLIESGSWKTVSKVRWTEQIISGYVDQRCVDSVIQHAEAHVGSKVERQLVVIELFREWVEVITPDHIDVAKSILRYVATLALEPVSFFTDQDLGGQSLKALLSVAKKRPELRQAIAPELTEIILKHLLPSGFWRGSEEALELALGYIDVFTDEYLQKVVESTLSLLEETNPETGMWPIVRPALNLLVSKSVKRFIKHRPELGQRIIATVLHFGLKQESENARVLFYLHDFDQTLLVDPLIREALQETVSKVRQKASGINSSNVVEQIQALLLAPAVTGIDGVRDALNGISLILSSSKGSRPSIALSYAYDPLLLIARNYQSITSTLNISEASFLDELKPLFLLTIELWHEATKRPLILAPFSLPPPTSLDQIVVHNWAFASMRFAELLQEGGKLEEVFAAAAAQPMLANGIALARATQAVAGSNDNFDAEAIRVENRETFYSTLGRRLVVLQRLTPEQASNLCGALTEQCLNHGPCEIDAAVFLGAIRLNLCDRFSRENYSNYLKRLENKRDLRLTLMPILQMMNTGEEVDTDD